MSVPSKIKFYNYLSSKIKAILSIFVGERIKKVEKQLKRCTNTFQGYHLRVLQGQGLEGRGIKGRKRDRRKGDGCEPIGGRRREGRHAEEGWRTSRRRSCFVWGQTHTHGPQRTHCPPDTLRQTDVRKHSPTDSFKSPTLSAAWKKRTKENTKTFSDSWKG